MQIGVTERGSPSVFRVKPSDHIGMVMSDENVGKVPFPVRQRLEDGKDVLLAQRAGGIGRIQAQAHVHLDAADARKIVALAVEEQLPE